MIKHIGACVLWSLATAASASEPSRLEATWGLGYLRDSGAWFETPPDGDEWYAGGHLYGMVEGRPIDRGAVDFEALLRADQVYVPGRVAPAEVRETDWVLVLGDGPHAGHHRLDTVQPGRRFALGGHVFESRRTDGALLVRPTGEVLAQVTATYARHAPRVLDLVVVTEDGATRTVTATPEHPFYLPDAGTYRPAVELTVGTTLLQQGGGHAVLRKVEPRAGDFTVYNLEVAGVHNYYAGDAALSVHNAIYNPQCAVLKGVGRLWDTLPASGLPGIDILDIPNWTPGKNRNWLQRGISQGQVFLQMSPINPDNLFGRNGPTVFGGELMGLRRAGYMKAGSLWIPPGPCK